MGNTRETRTATSEIKFVIEQAAANRIRQWARAHLTADPHGNGPYGDEYEISSLYFDTRQLDVFHRRGSNGRAKYRIRRYGDSVLVFLERKLRKPGILIKRRTSEAIDALDRLKRSDSTHGWGGEWFRQRILLRQLRPVCQVSYHRLARTIECGDGAARLTLDSALYATATDDTEFSPDRGLPLIESQLILELKYRVGMPAVFRRLVEDFSLSTQTSSKYRLAMSALRHVEARAEPLVLPDASGARLSC